MLQIKNNLTASLEYLKIFLKWLIVAVIVGVTGGLVGSAFHISVEFVTELRHYNKWLILLLPVGGVVIAILYRLFKGSGKIDTNRVINSVRSEESVPLVMAPLIFISTVITHLLGGSAGREGAALQLGGSIGYALGKVFRLNKKDKHIIVMSGMSAVFAAVFGTPVTAMFFALEVTSVGVMYYAGLVPCIISAFVASRVALFCGIAPVSFAGVITAEPMTIKLISGIIVLAALCALVSTLFCFSIHKCERLCKRFVPNKFLCAFLGGIVIILLTYAVGTTDYNGAGMDIITRAISKGDARWFDFLLKILFTAITISAGFKGGEIVPSFFIGSTFGCVMAPILGIAPMLGAAIGFIAVFCGVVNCPVASFVLAIEVFGGDAMLLFAVVCAVSYMMSGYSSLYKSQKIVYSKLEDKLITY